MIVVAIAVLVALAALVLFTTTRRRDSGLLSRETVKKDRSDSPFLEEQGEQKRGRAYERQAVAAAAPGSELAVPAETAPAPYVPVDPETFGVTRRQFFNRSIVAMFGLGLSGFGAAVLAFLWPGLSGGFGSKLAVGKVDDIISSVRDSREPFYVAEGRLYVVPFPESALDKARGAYSDAILPGMEEGVIALYQKCVHLGCRVPFCATSQWFECGCHGSQYNRVGEHKGGPAPRGLDMFPIEVNGGTVSVDTGIIVQGVPIGTNTTGQEAEGPHCVSGGSH